MKEERGNGKPDQVDVLKRREHFCISFNSPVKFDSSTPTEPEVPETTVYTEREREKSQRMLDLDFFWRMLLRAHDRRCCLQRME